MLERPLARYFTIKARRLFFRRGENVERRNPDTASPTGDFVQWKFLWDGYNAFYGRKESTALPETITAMTWSRFFDGYEPMHALIADYSGQLLGLVHFLFHRSTISLTSNCYLQDLFTLEAARGKGVARALIEEVYHCAERAGSSRVYWHTHESNEAAMKLYDKVAEKPGFLVYRKNL
jgi:GNAT superfamily N-acetyltransferase